MLLDNIKFKYFIILILLSLCYECYGLNVSNIKFNTDYVIDTNKKVIFNFTNTENIPALIKVHQNIDINIEIDAIDGLKQVDTPGHKVIPEFIIVKPGESIHLSIVSPYKSHNKVTVNFEKSRLNTLDLKNWSRLFDAVLDYTNGNHKQAAEKLYALGDELKAEHNNLMFETYFMSAISFYDAQLYDKALKLFDVILSFNSSSSNLLKASTLTYKARTLSIKGYKLQAIELFLQASKIFQQANDIRGFASSSNNIGLSYHLLGNLDLAKKYYDDALFAYKNLNDIKAVANQYINIGGLYFMQGLNSQAKDSYRHAINLSKKIEDISVEADALEMFAWLQKSQGDYAGLLLKWGDILKIRKELKDKSGITRAYRLIGQSYLSYGNDTKALQFLNKSLKRARKVSLTENYPVILNNIAQAYFNLGDIDSSQAFFQQALDYNIKVNNEFYSAKDYLGLAQIILYKSHALINQSDSELNFKQLLTSTLSSVNSAIAIYNKSQNKLNLLKALSVKAEIFLFMNDYDQALKQIEISKNISQNINDFSSKIETDFIHGKILLSMHKEKRAIKLFKSVLEKANVKRHQIINPKYRATFVANLENCRNLLVDTLISESIKNNDKNLVIEALMLSESGKAKSLNDLIHQTDSKTTSNKYIALQNQLQTLYYLKSDLQDKPHFKSIKLNRISQQIQELIFQLDVLEESNNFAVNENKSNKDRITQLQKSMDKKSLYVALRLTNKQSFIWQISRNAITVKLLPKKELIENNIRVLYDFFKSSPYGLKRYPTKINNSIAWLMDNVFIDIDFKNLEKLVISPHGMVQLLPTNVLFHFDKKYSSDIDISFTPSFMMEKKSNTKRNHFSKLLVIADPKFSNSTVPVQNENISTFRGNSFEELKFTIDEAQYITQLYGKNNVDLVLGRNSTKANVLTKIENQYEIIHFATHGLIDTEIPEMSGLVFSSNGIIDNNILTIDEIMNLQIHSNTVVLSACETAIGENIKEEGLIGLSYAFLAAGAQQVYATLWKIGDRSTLSSIKKMYSENNLKQGNLKITAPFWVKYEIL